jgi:SAM-dependent methyltransferase
LNAGGLFEDRLRAESFGELAELYDRARPSYPDALVDELLRDGARRVLDAGCGTGKAGSLFALRGCEVLGVEVDARMAQIARRSGLDVEISAFERWEPGGRRFDLVISGQAWHWIDPWLGSAKAAAALVEGGRIGLFWNVGDPPAHVRALLAPIYAQLEPGLENYSVVLGNSGRRAAQTLADLSAAGVFGPAGVSTFSWSQEYRTSEWLDFISTHSDHQALEPKRRERLLAAVAEAVEAVGGSFEVPYRTWLVSARLPVPAAS